MYFLYELGHSVLKMGEIQWKQVVTDLSLVTPVPQDFYKHTNNCTTVKTQNSLICIVVHTDSVNIQENLWWEEID